jgi:hypothetical protein
MKPRVILAILLVAAILSSSGLLASAQQGRTSSTIELAHVTVALSYPSTVQAGDSIVVSAQATAKEDLVMDELVVQLYLPNQDALQPLATGTLARGVTMKAGSQVSTDFKMTIPSGTPPSSLMAAVKENVRLMTSEVYYRCSNGMCYWEPNYTTYPQGQNIPQVPQGIGSHDISFIPLSSVTGPSSAGSHGIQTSTMLKLDYVNVQLSYPAIVMPGETATLNAKAVSHDNFELDSLDVHLYVPTQNNIKLIGDGNVVRGVIMTTNSEVSRDITFTVLPDAPAGSLLVVVTEDVRFPPTANSFGYGYAIEVYQNSSYPYNYRISPVPSVPNPNVISYAMVSYVNANTQATSTQSTVSQSQTQPLQQNPNNFTASQPNPQSQPAANTDGVQLVAAIVGIAVLASAIAFLALRRRGQTRQAQSTVKQP